MDEAQIQAPKLSSETPVFFPPHRRRHLKSETYRTLFRIFSQCYDDSFASQNHETNLNTENGGNESRQRTEEQGSQPVELVGGGDNTVEPESSAFEKSREVDMNGDDKGCEDMRLGEQMSIDQLEQLMGLEENEEFSNQKDASLGSYPAQLLIDELEHIVQGNEDISHEYSSMSLSDPSLQNQSGVYDSSNNNAKQAAVQQTDLSGNASQMLLCADNIMTTRSVAPSENHKDIHPFLNIVPSKKQETVEPKCVPDTDNITMPTFGDFEIAENHSLLVSEEIDASTEKNTVADGSNSCYKDDDRRSPKTNALRIELGTQLEYNESGKPSCDSVMVDYGNHTIEGMEEGEISGGYVMDGISMDMLLPDAEIPDNKANEEIINKCITDRNDFFCNEVNDREAENSFFSVDTADKTNKMVGLWEIDRNKTGSITDVVRYDKTSVDANDPILEAQKIEKQDIDGNNSLSLYGNILEEDNKMSAEQDLEDRPTKKRAPPSKEKRAKRKAKDRKKRAEKNRQLGVRRLKLHSISISKPKPMQYCRHYLHGRCQEGDNCKFSHDTVPLTKSKPCCHFARHSCMKGDDCPFDHELSKYPCSNFASKGFCNRGDDCLFSHKIPSEENPATASNAVEPEKKFASLLRDSASKKQKNNDGAYKYTSVVSCFSPKIHSHKITEKNLSETVLKQSEIVPKGASFVSVGNSPSADKLKQPISSQNGQAESHTDKLGPGTVRSSSEVLNITPLVVLPKGVNFLSFGRGQRENLSGSELASASSGGDNGVKQSAFDDSKTHNQSISAPLSDSTPKGIQPAVVPKGINFLSFGNASTKMPSQTTSTPFTDSTPKGMQTMVPKGINFLSFGRTSIDDSSDKEKGKMISDRNDGIDTFVKVQQSAVVEPQKSSSISSSLQSFPISLIQSSGHSASKINSDAPCSAQKVLFSTLAFAAKYESLMNLNQSAHAPEVKKEIDDEPTSKGTLGGSQNNLSKASKLLAFFSSYGSESKQ